jgi:hypothetical protein
MAAGMGAGVVVEEDTTDIIITGAVAIIVTQTGIIETIMAMEITLATGIIPGMGIITAMEITMATAIIMVMEIITDIKTTLVHGITVESAEIHLEQTLKQITA